MWKKKKTLADETNSDYSFVGRTMATIARPLCSLNNGFIKSNALMKPYFITF